MENPYLAIAGICLLIAVYMFAALKVPELMFIFRLKRGPAAVFGVDEDANRNLSHGIGRVLAPLLGIGALIAAGYFGMMWKTENQKIAQREAMREQRQQDTLDQTKKALGELPVNLVYKGERRRNRPTRALSSADRDTVQALLREISTKITIEDIDNTSNQSYPLRDAFNLDFDFETQNGPRRATVRLHPREKVIAFSSDAGRRLLIPAAGRWFQVKVPQELASRFGAIAKMKLTQIETP